MSGSELYRLVAGKKKWQMGNIEPRDKLTLLIYSPHSKVYWKRTLGADHNMNIYRKYIREGNLWIYFDDTSKGKMNEEREKEGMGYYDLNSIRELQIMAELLEKGDKGADHQTKQRAIQLEIEKIKNKYK
jgi:hypothetical protein